MPDDSGINSKARRHARRLRRDETPAEKALWRHLRDRQLEGFKFRRQQPIGHYVVDFFCPRAKLVVEVDGDTHAESARHDADRTGWLSRRGYRVVRFTNADVHRNLQLVLEAILRECRGRMREE